MLQLTDIVKEYAAGNTAVTALRGVSVTFRRSEFVAILGPSGCGKTTLLNIIGGLDQYTSGEMKINGVSTRRYKDRDWDAYRNHSIGFVFQSYNLIPHQSVLANVELALTISGVSKAKRRAMAVEALKKVGLGDQLKKRPNQMSGGQMQRVAIARALVNDPEILLADEPTGALDSATSLQVMEILKEIAKEKLVIMVTHNPELAQRYATRTIRLLDGQITDDSMPYTEEEAPEAAEKPDRKKKKPSMSFWTACSLSLNNLMTKKTRTLLTSFAGSIGIIGIALILSLSNGINLFIDRVQQDTLSSYPLTIQAESVDMSGLIATMMGGGGENTTAGDRASREENAVYTSPVLYDLWNSFFSIEAEKNDLKSFREYLQKADNDILPHLSAIRYSYPLHFNAYVKDHTGAVASADAMGVLKTVYQEVMGIDITQYSAYMGGGNGVNVWEELLTEKDGTGINGVLKQQYDVISGRWPEAYNEVVLVVNEYNEVSDLVLCTLGLKTTDELVDATRRVMDGQMVSVSDEKWSFDDVMGLTVKLVLPAEAYRKDETSGMYVDLSASKAGMEYLYENDGVGVELKICGIIRPNSDAVGNMLRGSLCYTGALTEYALDRIGKQDVIRDQLADRNTDVLTGLPFKTEENELSEGEKAAAFRAYLASLSDAERLAVCTAALATPSEAEVQAQVDAQLNGVSTQQLRETMISFYEQEMGITSEEIRTYIMGMEESSLKEYAREMLRRTVISRFASQAQAQLAAMTPEQIVGAFNAREYTDGELAAFHDTFLPAKYSEQTLEQVLDQIGYVDPASPSAVSLYCDTFEEKDAVSEALERYNEGKEESDQLKYTDYVKQIMSSVSMVLNAVSYVLIAFVSISLVVSSIMIGIITYISVLERTKEIGILRAIGASKRDISRVFNAETLIVGLAAGLIGIALTLLLTIPINYWVHALSGLTTINAVLPWLGGVILVLISMFLTFIAGLIPSRIAAKKDPVEALRTE